MNELESPELLNYSGANIYRVSSRIKTLDSVLGKIARRKLNFDKDSLSKIDDIVGARIVCMFQEDLERIHQYISSSGAFKLCALPEAYVWDGMEWVSSEEFSIERKSSGYGAIHYIAQLNTEIVGEHNPIGSIKFELQVRTLMQEAWAALEHSVGYKNSIPDRIRGYFDSAADLLGLIDRAFQRLKNESNRLQKEISEEQLNDGQQINFYTLKQLAQEHFKVKLAGRSFSKLLKHLIESPIKTVEMARKILNTPLYTESVDAVYKNYMMRLPEPEDFLYWLPLYNNSYSQVQLESAIEKRLFQTPEYRKIHAKKLLIETLRVLDQSTLAGSIEKATSVSIVDRDVCIEISIEESGLLYEQREKLLYSCRQCFGPVLQVYITTAS
ncbi:MAG: hypothetical protein JNN15_10110 [Blastocatellia bacterium]|nr:hypothetical protein [Blastocatellia bacterium]